MNEPTVNRVPERPDQPLPVPLDVARTIARRFLTEAEALDLETASTVNVYASWGALTSCLRQVLNALDHEQGEQR